MIEKKIRKFFNSVSIPSCRPAVCEDCAEEFSEDFTKEIEVTHDAVEDDAPGAMDYVRFMAKTLLILSSVLIVAKTVAFLVNAVSGEED